MIKDNHHITITTRYYSMFRSILFCFALFFMQIATAQPYAPPVGQPGTTALYKDSSAFVNWASECRVHRGYQDISNPSAGFASVGDSSLVTGFPDVMVLSLGDGGSATCTFPFFISNGAGPDFAVFENSFDDTFLELAFVEVSSDGIHFFRFPSHSLTDTVNQTASFGATDATKINNLAGKYRGEYGTPFDLQELSGIAGLNINAVSHVKVVDVVGSVSKQYATRDSHGNMINDPWPTAFPSGGFDLDAIGVIHQGTLTALPENIAEPVFSLYPNPATQLQDVHIVSPRQIVSVTVIDVTGHVLLQTSDPVIPNNLLPGIYFVKATTEKGIVTKKLLVH